MKQNIVIRLILVFTFLLALGVTFRVITSAHAASASDNHTNQAAAGLPTRVDCGSSPDLIIIADNNTNKDCFSGSGLIGVGIYNVTFACAYNGHGAVLQAQYDNQPVTSEFINPNTCIDISSHPINVVTGIDIYN